MSNHGPNPFRGFDEPLNEDAKFEAFNDKNRPEYQNKGERIRALLDTTGFRGALGEFPEGKLQGDDEGSIQFAIGEKDGKVVVDFGTSVHWLGMTPQQAAEFASTLLKKAREVGRKQGETISFVIG